ncbi:MAG: hypothetical protein IPM24_13695 [Bryobacterales bacterium]|nr:hypothetical protein [Bryobacterales bacterium]
MQRRDFFKLGGLLGLQGLRPLTSWAQASGAPLLKVGYAERDISPEIGMEQPGGYGKSFHRTFHDPCKARAVVFDDGAKRVALVGLDALLVLREDVLAARQEIQRRCGIAPDSVMIGASHSHSSGPVGMIRPGDFDHASAFVKELAYEKSSNADLKYLDMMRRQIVDAVCDADQKRKELACGIGSGREDRAGFNRRFRMKNGQSWTHPGKGNPDIIGPAGPIDPEVGVIGTFDPDGNLVGCVVNYACHATTSPGGISANWVYDLERTIRGQFGSHVVVVFVQGASGDITQVDNLDPHVNPSGKKWSQIVGGRVGAESIKVLLSMHAGSLAPVAAAQTVMQIPRRRPSPERLKRSLELVKKDIKEVGATDWIFAKEIVLLDAILQKAPSAEVEVQAIQVGPAVFVSNPAEYFCDFGLDIKRRSPFPFTYPVELANGCVGYVPTAEALSPTGGGYETRLTAYSNLEPAAGQKMADAGVQLASRLTPGPVPRPELAPPFQPAGAGIGPSPWTYGNVPPEVR